MTRSRQLALAWAVTVAIGGWACSDDAPSTPTTPTALQIGGTWSGSLESSNYQPQTVGMVLTQNGVTISGTWSSPALVWAGAVTGSLSGDVFTGSLTLVTPGATGGNCTGNATATGTASATTLVLTSTGFTSPCGGMPASVRINLRK
jgi:hypothetical protein